MHRKRSHGVLSLFKIDSVIVCFILHDTQKLEHILKDLKQKKCFCVVDQPVV